MRCRIFTDGILDRMETAINDFLKDIQYQTFLGSQMMFDHLWRLYSDHFSKGVGDN